MKLTIAIAQASPIVLDLPACISKAATGLPRPDAAALSSSLSLRPGSPFIPSGATPARLASGATNPPSVFTRVSPATASSFLPKKPRPSAAPPAMPAAPSCWAPTSSALPARSTTRFFTFLQKGKFSADTASWFPRSANVSSGATATPPASPRMKSPAPASAAPARGTRALED